MIQCQGFDPYKVEYFESNFLVLLQSSHYYDGYFHAIENLKLKLTLQGLFLGGYSYTCLCIFRDQSVKPNLVPKFSQSSSKHDNKSV